MRTLRNQNGGIAFVLPLLVLVMGVFNLPVLMLLVTSIWGAAGFTGTHYAAIWLSPVYLKVIANTLQIAAIVTVACVLIGYPLAFWILTLGSRGRVIAASMVILPFWISVLVRNYAWIVLLGNAGIVNRSLLESGLTSTSIQFLYRPFGVVLGMTNMLLPFIVLPLLSAMIKIDMRLLQSAASLGASPFTVFRRVFLPLTVPATLAGAILVFVLSLGFYITPAILGGGKVPMVATMLDLLINQLPQWEVASAISTLLLAATLIAMAVGSGRRSKWKS